MRALPVTAGRGAVACAAAPVPRRSLLLSTAAAGAALHSDPALTLSRNAAGGAAAKVRASVDAAQAATFAGREEALAWAKSDNRRLLHVVYRVGDLDKTIKDEAAEEARHPVGEVHQRVPRLRTRGLAFRRRAHIQYYGVDKYDIGEGFGHFGIAVEDVAKTVELIRAKGGKVTREPGPVKGGKTVIAFVEDPDGYKFEILERPGTPEPLCQVMLRVGDLDRAISFYEKACGMELLRKRDNPDYKYTVAMMGYGPEDKNAVLELTYNYGVTEYEKGNAYGQIAIGTDDVYKTAEIVKLFGGQVVREPGPLPGISTKITSILDPDGWKSVFVDNVDFAKELE
ncbi:hypothetical protein ACP70R_029296 [Stipagrostis hirtigluma subsp. patula]